MSNHIKSIVLGLITFVAVTSIVIGFKIHQANAAHKTRVVFTPDQQEAIDQLNQAREEAVKATTELNNAIASARATVPAGTPDMNIDWLFNGDYGNGNNYAIVNNNKPIYWGLRSDGVVLWKAQQ
jgi:hypothetical protein